MTYLATKTYGAEQGLSATFRQWRTTDTHCRFLHGYALGFRITFGATKLDARNWVYNFGECKWIKKLLADTFDHKTVVAIDDPEIEYFKVLDSVGLIQMVTLPNTGCEKFAEYIYNECAPRITTESGGRVRLLSVECFEHQGNSATYRFQEGA